MVQPGPQAELAESSGYRNDCGFHCITHTLLKLSPGVLDDLALNYPAYQLIVDKFYERYALPGERTLRNMVTAINAYTHPFDHEILLGRVLREVLRENPAQFGLTEAELPHLRDGEQVYDDTLAKFVNALGADFSFLPIGADEAFRVNSPFNRNPPSPFVINLTHIPSPDINGREQGGHYEFTFPDQNLNAYHNRAFNLQYGDDGEILPNGAALYDIAIAQNTIGAQREINIRNAVQMQVQSAQQRAQRAPVPLARSQPGPDPQHVPLFTMKQGPDIKPAPQQTQAGPSLTAKKVKEPPKQVPVTPSAPMFHPPTDPKVFRVEFVAKLKERFGAGWEVTTPTPDEINVTNTAVPARNVNIVERAETMKFTAPPGMIADVAKAANAYQEVLGSRGEEIEYEVDVRDEAQCREFLRELNDSGLGMRAIATIKINGQVVSDEKRNELMEPYRASSPGLR